MENKHEPLIIKVILHFARASTRRMGVSLWAVLEGLMAVSDFVEEMYLILLGKEGDSDTVYRSISPALAADEHRLRRYKHKATEYRPRNRSRLWTLDIRNNCYMLLLSRSRDLRSRNWTKLEPNE